MGLIDFIHQMFTDYTIQTIVMGTAVLGLLSGLLGTWAVLRRQSLLGDAVAHAALPGIAIAFLISGEKNTLLILAGAAAAGWIATLWIRGITLNTRIKSDTALAVVMAVFFGFGMVLITLIQQMPNARQAGLESFLFGQAATLLRHDVAIMAIIAGVALVTVFLFWKEFKLLAFDQQYANSLGFNIKFLDILLNTLIVVAIIIGLQAVGVVLMSALLIAPAAAARQWTNKLGAMALLAAIFGALSGITGTFLSGAMAKMPTGPLIVLSSVSIVIFSFLFAPQRGLIAQFILKMKVKKRIAHDTLLVHLYHICRKHKSKYEPHSLKLLKPLPDYNNATIKHLHDQKLITLTKKKEWCLTEKGIMKVEQLIKTGG
jgi:manganese/zinc/iron transport system permease protein